ncbi:MAG: hypothetical protein C5B55_00005, partial [Blastocatellia bacterium]
ELQSATPISKVVNVNDGGWDLLTTKSEFNFGVRSGRVGSVALLDRQLPESTLSLITKRRRAAALQGMFLTERHSIPRVNAPNSGCSGDWSIFGMDHRGRHYDGDVPV